jgi:hypothetical protein
MTVANCLLTATSRADDDLDFYFREIVVLRRIELCRVAKPTSPVVPTTA